MLRFSHSLFLLFITPAMIFAGVKSIAKITVNAGVFDRQDTPVSLALEQFSINTDNGALLLYETGKTVKTVPCQLEPGSQPRLWWILDGTTTAGHSRYYELVQTDSTAIVNSIQVVADEKKLVIKRGDKSILQYNQAITYPPEGIDPLFKRSGYIHPLWSPSGEIMTRIQAPDHYHHYGIWNPWTKTVFENRSIDFWNLYEGQGTVRFAGFLSFINGPVYGGFKALQEHVDFTAKGADKTAINEVWDIRVWNCGDNVWLWDLTTTLNCPAGPVLLEAYRYGGGIGFRAAEDWTRENSQVLTSEGKTRMDADGTRARWCDVQGEFSDGNSSGIVFMSHPSNREFPEPMRVWPIDANNGRGDMYFEFCPIRDKDWSLEPGTDYVLKYRMLVYDQTITPETAEMYWKSFAHPPLVKIVK